MLKYFPFVVMLTLLLMSMLTFAFNIQPIEASPDGFTPHDPILIEDNSEFTLENGVSSGSGTAEDPFIIEKWDINASTVVPSPSFPYGGGIQIRNTNAHFIIRNVWVHDGFWDSHRIDGIFLDSVTNGRIADSRMTNNEYDIFLWHSSHIEIINCSTLNYRSGCIRLSYSSYNNVSYNNITPVNTGIDLWAYCHYNRIVGNEISNNNVGVMVYRSYYNSIANNTILGRMGYMGMEIWRSHNNEMNGNNISNNERGIFLYSHGGESYNNMFVRNVLFDNVYGIYMRYRVEQVRDNLFYHNSLIDNTNQAYVEGHNKWDNGYPSGGNFWSDYVGVDLYGGPYQNETGSDGMGDTPYVIDGNNTDNYPLLLPLTPTPPLVASIIPRDQFGNDIDVFISAADVYVKGSRYPASTDLAIYVIPDGDDPRPESAETVTYKTTDGNGLIAVTLVWTHPLVCGVYGIWLDVNLNEIFDEDDVWNEQAFAVLATHVIPEPSVLISILLWFGALAIFYVNRKRQLYLK